MPGTGTTGHVGRRLRDILGLDGHHAPHVGGRVRRHTRKPGSKPGGAVGRNVGKDANHLLNYLFAP